MPNINSYVLREYIHTYNGNVTLTQTDVTCKLILNIIRTGIVLHNGELPKDVIFSDVR